MMQEAQVAPAVLSVENLVVRFEAQVGSVHAVNGVSFDIDRGETLGLVGESGCGKSVTSLAIMRLLPASARIAGGRVLLDGRSLLEIPATAMRDVRGKEIALIPQNPMTSLNPVLAIGKQLTETIQAHRKTSRDQARARAAELLGLVGISNPERSLSEYPHRFSGGMQQRILIAMALALSPKLLIADEPTTALDVTIQAQVLDLLRHLTRRSSTSLLLITHDLGVVAGMTQRTAVMYAGLVVETASTARLFAAPRHPYTVGLLRSIPRLDEGRSELVAIEGMPPEQRRAPSACPFAPRCAWRLPVCWSVNPPLQPSPTADSSEEDAEHLIACHNPVRPEEVEPGHPLRPGFVAAPGPGPSPAVVAASGERPPTR